MCAYRWQRRRSSGHTTLVELALPSTLQFLFLVYPLVTNIAFDAFPCFEFADGSRWLKADVSVHQRETSSNLPTAQCTTEIAALFTLCVRPYRSRVIRIGTRVTSCRSRGLRSPSTRSADNVLIEHVHVHHVHPLMCRASVCACAQVGLLVLNALLLFAARRKKKLETPLSKATTFLHQEYMPPETQML